MHPLRQYLMSMDEPITDFAARVGASRQTLYRIISRAQAPKPALARLIIEATGGEVSWEALYEDACAAPAAARAAASPVVLDPAPLKTAIAVVYGHFAPAGAAAPPDAMIARGVKAAIEVNEALSRLGGDAPTERLALILRLVLEAMLNRDGTRLSPTVIDRAVKLGVELYDATSRRSGSKNAG